MTSINEVISNLINGNTNLTAIIEILKSNFHKRTIMNFTVNLIEAVAYTLTEEETKNNPRKIVQDVEKLYSRWETRNLWNICPSITFSQLSSSKVFILKILYAEM